MKMTTSPLECVASVAISSLCCGTKPVLVNAIVCAVNICFVYLLSCLNILWSGGGL